MFSGFSSGVILIIVGFLVLIKALFGIHIPIFRLMIGCLLVYWGISMITSMRINRPFRNFAREDAIFCQKTIDVECNYHGSHTYNVVFGQLKLNIPDNLCQSEDHTITIHTVFGNTEIFVPSDVAIDLIVTNFCGNIDYPQGNYCSFGTKKTRVGSATTGCTLTINAQVAFGNVSIIRKNKEDA